MGLLLTSDEEGEAVDGIVRGVDELKRRDRRPDYCLVGEPSSQQYLGDTVRVGRRGSINARLQVNGIQGHTAFPENLDNPAHRLAPFLDELVKLDWDSGDEEFPASHCQVASIRGGTGASNVTPANVELLVNFRNGPESPSQSIRSRFEELLIEHEIIGYFVGLRTYPTTQMWMEFTDREAADAFFDKLDTRITMAKRGICLN